MSTTRNHITQPGRQSLHRSWISVAVLPLAFVAATLLGEWLLGLQGYGSGETESIDLGVALAAGIPAVLLLLAPSVSAIMFGLRARRLGIASGIIPATIGAGWAILSIALNTLPLLLGVG